MDKALRQKFRSDFLTIRRLLNKFDPCGFIRGGAPDDEYDDLTHKIISLAYFGRTRNEIKREILFDLENQYGLDLAAFEDNRQIEIQFLEEMDMFLNGVELTIDGQRASR